MKNIETIIPAYRPAPCDCCVYRENEHKQSYYWPDCDCGNKGDLIEAAMWCSEMKIADLYTKLISDNTGGK